MSSAFARHIYRYSVILISSGLCVNARSAPNQLPDEDTVRKPRVAPRTIPAVDVRSP